MAYRVSILNSGVKIYDTTNKKIVWLTAKSFAKILLEGIDFEYCQVPYGTYAIKSGSSNKICFAIYRAERKLATFYRDSDKNIKKLEIVAPNVMFFVTIYNRVINKVSVFACDSLPALPTGINFSLYEFPFPNSSAGGDYICLGENHDITVHNIADKFWSMPFTKELISNKVKGYANTWDFLMNLGSRKLFPNDLLVKYKSFKEYWDLIDLK